MKILLIITSILLLSFSFVLGVTMGNTHFAKDTNKSECTLNFEYVNDSVGCVPKQAIRKHLYTDLVFDLTNYIQEQEKNNSANQISIYFRDLQQGPTFGIKEKEAFAPASLLKVPLLIAYYNLSDQGENILQQKIQYSGTTEMLEQTLESAPSLSPDKEYSVEQLLESMIISSDNLSYVLLFNALKKLYPNDNILESTMIELGIVSPRKPTEDTLTVKSYASIFRQLYNASYLSPEYSEKALDLLSKSSYKGFASELPSSIKTAHKYGERKDENNTQQLHDCGVIYFPNNPYLLCIMTKGEKSEDLQKIIAEISKRVYKEVESRRI